MSDTSNDPIARLARLEKRRDAAAEDLRDSDQALKEALSRYREANSVFAHADFAYIQACDELGVVPGLRSNADESGMTEVERKVWAEWNSMPDEEFPVQRIAEKLGMKTADVAFIVYPSDRFNRWDDSREGNI
jgi:hypothetical protein